MILKQSISFFLTLFIPLLYILQLLVLIQNTNSFSAPLSISIIGLILAIGGIMLWILSYFYLGFSFGVLPQKQKKITKGVYQYLDHPMYIGIWLTFLGLSFALQSWEGLFFLQVILTPVLALRGYFEERDLIK